MAIILGDVLQMDTVSNFLSLITVREMGVREAAREEKPQASERDKNTPKFSCKNGKIQVAVHSPQPISIWDPSVRSRGNCELCFFGSKDRENFFSRSVALIEAGVSGRWPTPGKLPVP